MEADMSHASSSGMGQQAQHFRYGDESAAQRQRVSIACVYCRQRKIKCNGGSTCNNCLQQGRECQYRGVLPDEAQAVRQKKAAQKARRQARLAGQFTADTRAAPSSMYPVYDDRYASYAQGGSFSSGSSGGRPRSSGTVPNFSNPSAGSSNQHPGHNVGFQGPSSLGSGLYNPQSNMGMPSYAGHVSYPNMKGSISGSYAGSAMTPASSQNYHSYSAQNQPFQAGSSYPSHLLMYNQGQQTPFASSSSASASLGSQHLTDSASSYTSGLPASSSASYVPYHSGSLSSSGLPNSRQMYSEGSEQDTGRPMLPPMGQGGSASNMQDTNVYSTGGHGGGTSSSFVDANFRQGAGSELGLQPGVARNESLSNSPQPNNNAQWLFPASQSTSSMSSAEPRDSAHGPTNASVAVRDSSVTHGRPYAFERTSPALDLPYDDTNAKLYVSESGRLLPQTTLY